MAKFFAFFKENWFGMLTSFILLVGFLFFLLVLLSPRQDLQKRGFIPCTEALAQNILSCPAETKYRCIFGEIMQNSWCDIKVIGSGFKLWASGKQGTPWANYIFKPEISGSAEQLDEIDTEFYNSSDHPELDLLKLQQLNEVMEKNNAEIEAKQDKENLATSKSETQPQTSAEKQPEKEIKHDKYKK